MKLKKLKFIVSLFSLHEEHWLWSFDKRKKKKNLRALNLEQEKNKTGFRGAHTRVQQQTDRCLPCFYSCHPHMSLSTDKLLSA